MIRWFMIIKLNKNQNSQVNKLVQNNINLIPSLYFTKYFRFKKKNELCKNIEKLKNIYIYIFIILWIIYYKFDNEKYTVYSFTMQAYQ